MFAHVVGTTAASINGTCYTTRGRSGPFHQTIKYQRWMGTPSVRLLRS